jgi:hypothetical protein
MIDVVVCSAEDTTAEVVTKAFDRSFTSGQVRRTNSLAAAANVVVALGPTDADAVWLEPLARRRAKIMLFGPVGPRIARLAGVSLQAASTDLAAHCGCPPAPAHGTSESSAGLVYASTGLGSGAHFVVSTSRTNGTISAMAASTSAQVHGRSQCRRAAREPP